MSDVFSHFKSHPLVKGSAVLWGIAGAILGYLGHDFLSFRSEERAAIRSDYAQVESRADAVHAQLQGFALAARGKRLPPSDQEIATLRASLEQLHATAHHITARVPSASDSFERYSHAMVALKSSVEQLHGPLNGRPFVEAVSEYFVAENKFDKTVTDAQTCFVCLGS